MISKMWLLIFIIIAALLFLVLRRPSLKKVVAAQEKSSLLYKKSRELYNNGNYKEAIYAQKSAANAAERARRLYARFK